MDIYKNLIKKLRVFHSATNLPVAILQNKTILFQLPSEQNTIHTFLKSAFQIYDTMYDPCKAFFYKNEFKECYIVMDYMKYCLLVGPLLTEHIYESTLNNIIMNNKISIKLKSQLGSYYDQLTILDKNQYYYIGKLLEHIIVPYLDTHEEESDISINDSSFLPDEYFINTVENRQSMFHHPPYFLEQELLNNIKEGNKKRSIQIIKEINSLKRAKLSDQPLRSIKNSLICSVTLFTRAIIEGGVDPENAFTLCDSFIQTIEKTDTISTLINLEYHILESFVDSRNSLTSNLYSIPIQQAISYIHEHLTEKITLKEVADLIYVHPNYLSSLFIKEVGISFKEYINKKKIEESKYYIQYTNTSLSDISTFFNFCNQSYFTQQFKRFTGLSPNQFRVKYMK